MNGEHQSSVEDVVKAVRTSDVFDLFFPHLHRTLLVDLRTNAVYPPFVRLVPMARNSKESVQYLIRMRPGLPRLDNLTMIPWDRYVRSLTTTGVSTVLLERVADTGDGNAVEVVQRAIEELRRLERAELIAAVTGDNYHTVWARRHR
ncbi:MAG: hypothetical protein EXR67_00630 [Dehalococcoidia bacterium]|nr:hypothetical protein [Dehalococcoidia bacterium]